jgi:hypothetical protein
VKNQDSMGKTNFFLSTLSLQPLGSFSHMATCRSSSTQNIGKMNFKPILNKTSPWAHTELELDVLGVPRKLVKYSLMQKKKLKENYFS